MTEPRLSEIFRAVTAEPPVAIDFAEVQSQAHRRHRSRVVGGVAAAAAAVTTAAVLPIVLHGGPDQNVVRSVTTPTPGVRGNDGVCAGLRLDMMAGGKTTQLSDNARIHVVLKVGQDLMLSAQGPCASKVRFNGGSPGLALAKQGPVLGTAVDYTATRPGTATLTVSRVVSCGSPNPATSLCTGPRLPLASIEVDIEPPYGTAAPATSSPNLEPQVIPNASNGSESPSSTLISQARRDAPIWV